MNNKSFGNDKCTEIGEFECPFCHEHLQMNPRQYANHIRWCKKNPSYERILGETTQNLKEATNKRMIKKYGQYKEYDVICSCCGNHLKIKEREGKFDPTKKYYCSRSCANTHHRTEESKRKIREIILNKLRDSDSFKFEHNAKLYKFKKVCPHCKNEFYTNDDHQICCSRICSKRYRDLKECVNKDKMSIYRNQCSFKFGISLYPDEFDFELIKKNGWYHAKNHGDNLNGVSRDHMYSVKEGFNNSVDPYIISHPANCQLMLHSDNESKHNKCSITLEELKKRVDFWNIKYGEYPNNINYELLSNVGIEIARQPSCWKG